VVVFKLPPNIENLEKLGLNERQIKAIQYIQEKGMITNREYQKLCATSWDTAYRDLSELVQKSILRREGKGRSTHYLMII
jgi:ATP-dependent DNA helicase RecG